MGRGAPASCARSGGSTRLQNLTAHVASSLSPGAGAQQAGGGDLPCTPLPPRLSRDSPPPTCANAAGYLVPCYLCRYVLHAVPREGHVSRAVRKDDTSHLVLSDCVLCAKSRQHAQEAPGPKAPPRRRLMFSGVPRGNTGSRIRGICSHFFASC